MIPSPHDEFKEPGEQTPEQRLSNRTILRFQELAKELQLEIRTIPGLLPSGYKIKENGVLFVSADRSERYRFDEEGRKSAVERAEQRGVARYYNLRLLRCFRFINSDWQKDLWEAIKDHVLDFECLFIAASIFGETANRFMDFKNAVAAADDPDAPLRAHDLLIDAIAVFPYTGLLPGALDPKPGVEWNSVMPPRWFEVCGVDSVYRCSLKSFASFTILDEELKCPGEDAPELETKQLIYRNSDFHERDRLEKLYLNFIDHFTLARKPEEWKPFVDASRIEGKVLEGFAVPLYDFWDSEGNPIGGFEGWLVVAVEEDTESDASKDMPVSAGGQEVVDAEPTPKGPAPDEEKQLLSILRIKAFNEAVHKFALQVSDERMRELVESEGRKSTSAECFAFDNYSHFGGWCGQEIVDAGHHITGLVMSGEFVQFGFLNGESASTGKPGKLQWTPTSAPKEIEHVAIQLPSGRRLAGNNIVETPIFILRRRRDTVLPADVEDLNDYGVHLARSFKDLHEAAKLRKKDRERGRIDEWATFGHEMKHVAAALSGRWFVQPGKGGEIPGHAIAPVPELIAGAGSMIYLWCPAGDVREWLSDWNPQEPLLMQMLERFWDTALYGILASLAKTRELSSAGSVREVSAIVEKAKQIWRFNKWWIINADACAFSDPSSPVLQRILRAFSILSNNLIRHAAISDNDRSCLFSVEKGGEVTIETDTAHEHLDAAGNYSNGLSKDFPSLNNVRSGAGSTKSQGLGKKILSEIIESELGGSIEKLPGHRHKVRILIPAQI